MMKLAAQDISPFIAAFEAARDHLPGGGALAGRRRLAIDRFRALGLPGRKSEDWRYAELRPLADTAFAPRGSTTGPDAAALDALALPGSDGVRIVFINGRLDAARSRLDLLPAGLVVRSLCEALAADTERLAPKLAEVEAEDAFAALNTAMMADGHVIEIAEGTHLEMPIEIVHLLGGADDAAVHLRNIVRLGAGARAEIVESFGDDGRASFSNAVTQISIADDGRLDLVRRQLQGARAIHMARDFVTLGRGHFRMSVLAAGAASARQELQIVFTAPGGHADYDGIQIAGGEQVLDTRVHLDHAVPGCTSRQRYRGVLAGSSRASFSGKVLVRRDARKTDARQHAASLLLDRGAEANTRPELEIYADDVQCAHGATVGELDAGQLFFLMARGLAPDEARALLVEGFIAELVGGLDNDMVRELLLADARHALGRKAGA